MFSKAKVKEKEPDFTFNFYFLNLKELKMVAGIVAGRLALVTGNFIVLFTFTSCYTFVFI